MGPPDASTLPVGWKSPPSGALVSQVQVLKVGVPGMGFKPFALQEGRQVQVGEFPPHCGSARGGEKGWGRGGGGHGQTAASWSRLPASRPLFSPLPSAKELLSQFSGLCQRKGSTPGCNLVSRGPASARPPAAILDCSPGCLRLHPAPSTAAVRERRTSVVSLLFSK